MYRILAIVVLVVSIVGGIGYKFNQLDNTIAEQTAKIIQLENDRDKLTLKLALTEANQEGLSSEVDRLNDILDTVTESYIDNSKELEEWKKKPPIIKYKTKVVREIITETKWHDTNCTDAVELNQAIGEISYDDL